MSRHLRLRGLQCREWDKRKRPCDDITLSRARRLLRQEMKKGNVTGIMAAPLCPTFCTRHRGRLLRSRSLPWGLSNLLGPEADAVQYQNRVVNACINIVQLADRLKIPWIVALPHTSLAWDALGSMLSCPQSRTVVLDQCVFGGPWRRRMRLLCGHFEQPSLSRLYGSMCHGRVCSRTGRPHQGLEGATPQGVPWAVVSQRLPPRLSRSLAYAFSEEVFHSAFFSTSV